MGSTGEPDRKRRQLSSLSPTAGSAKKQHLLPVSEDKKIDIAILQYRNQKLTQKVETQKDEYLALEKKYSQLKGKHQPYDSMLKAVNNALKELARDLESCSVRTREKSCKKDVDFKSSVEEGAQSTFHEAFLKRLTETGAIESSSLCDSSNIIGGRDMVYERSKNGMCNLVSAIDNLWNLKDGIRGAVLKKLSAGSCRHQSESEVDRKVKSLRSAFTDVFLKHKSVSIELHTHQDADGKNKVELRRLRGELQNTADELKERNYKLENLKAQRDAAKGVGFPVLNLGSKHVTGDKISDKVKDLHDMESALKELKDQSSCHLMEIKGLHKERIKILQELCTMQNKLKSVTYISSSQAYLLLRDQVETSKAQVFEYQSLFEKLQAEKDHLVWKERELNVKSDVGEVLRKSAATNDSKSTDLTNKIQKQIDEIKVIEAKLEEASREPGRKEIIAEFKGLVSSFPNKMGTMQSQLRRYKETASGVHSLRADVQSLSNILDRKVNECETLYARSEGQIAERQKLQNMVQDIEENEAELKLILEMLRRESTDSREILEARDSEYKAWANVQSLKASLDEHDLELRVKIANEAEARSQQRLAAAEAEFADMRQKLEAFKRDTSRLAGILKSKNEEIESYLSEIESIGQAYDDMQTQNQQLLQQITERDDYNIKLVLEGLKSRQIRDSLLMDKRTLEGEIQQAKLSLNFFDAKAGRIEDQLKVCADQVQRLEQDKYQASMTMETTQKRFSDVKRFSRQSRDSLEESQCKVEESRMALLDQQIGLEKERFEKRRIMEELEVLRRKISLLRAQTEGSSIIKKLQQELNEYREILKCTICLERTKQVVITKCYHLFCHQCVQHITESRHRKCPTCSTTFGPNDVKPVYI